jgi:putative oxygen-independent coproporphyrinogen III oxidase
VAEAAVLAEGPVATSVFFGGGTPSLLPAPALARILSAIPRDAGAEVTVECNPETVDLALLAGYRDAGVTRISLGVQSMSAPVLAQLGRQHRPAAVAAAVEAVRRVGFGSFNLDLIFGVAGESLRSWEATLRAALDLEPPHLSAYALTVEPGTPLAATVERHPDNDRQADMYLLATELLGSRGLEWYEISNFSRAGHECRHNLLYWRQGDYRGLGCAAHSHHAGRRWWNVRTPERYITAIGAGRSPEAGTEVLGEATRRREALELALRTRGGVLSEELDDLDDLIDAGLVELEGSRVVLTVGGRLLANEVCLRIRRVPEPV